MVHRYIPSYPRNCNIWHCGAHAAQRCKHAHTRTKRAHRRAGRVGGPRRNGWKGRHIEKILQGEGQNSLNPLSAFSLAFFLSLPPHSLRSFVLSSLLFLPWCSSGTFRASTVLLVIPGANDAVVLHFHYRIPRSRSSPTVVYGRAREGDMFCVRFIREKNHDESCACHRTKIEGRPRERKPFCPDPCPLLSKPPFSAAPPVCLRSLRIFPSLPVPPRFFAIPLTLLWPRVRVHSSGAYCLHAFTDLVLAFCGTIRYPCIRSTYEESTILSFKTEQKSIFFSRWNLAVGI